MYGHRQHAFCWRLHSSKPWLAGPSAVLQYCIACWLVLAAECNQSLLLHAEQTHAGLCLRMWPKIMLPHWHWIQVCVQGPTNSRSTLPSTVC